ncbi:MAG: hypothetical protein ACOC5T_08360 [Elusimicrobiota bacterium]
MKNKNKKLDEEDIQEIADRTIEDLKNLFPYRIRGRNTKTKTLMINEKKMGRIRYLLIKNFNQLKKSRKNE